VIDPARLLLHCRGTVQGVGFRPFVHRLASALELSGEVENVDGAVRVDLHGERPALERFLGRLSSELPVPARLEPVEPSWLPPLSQPPAGLRIAAAAPRPLGTGLIAPALVADRAPCKACLAELADPANRRHRYPFISCCACGPRYSIATATPFARAHTTLAAFPLCPACRREFSDPADRRFHAETIGCPACGPQLSLVQAASADREPIQAAAALLLAGGILALQGVGGFQLLVDASQPEAIARLRRLKRRPHKPLALLVHDPAALENCVQISPLERDLLHAPAAPIVLLRRADPLAAEAWPGVAPGSAQLGVMLSASPLHQLLARAVGRPLVATSGNLSGDLLCTDPQEARQRLAGIADALLHHNRPIARPLDDSLVQVVEGRPRLLRRARGHAPAALLLPLAPPVDCRALALGGDLKNAAAEASGGHIRLAPHLGDLAGPRQHRMLEVWLQEPRGGPQPPQLIACDAHPGYVSQRLANDALTSWNRQAAGSAPVRLVPVQHHRAHGLAVAAEHGLPLPLLVWAWDGLGYAPGQDTGHQLWGGELLRLNSLGSTRPAAERLAALRPFPLPGGERAMREPRRVALGLLAALEDGRWLDHPAAQCCREAFAEAELPLLLAALRAGCQAPQTSSVGRLFDGVASLLGACQRQSHEGQAGLLLEGLARRAQAQRRAEGQREAESKRAGGSPLLPLLPAPDLPLGWLDWQPLLRHLLEQSSQGVDAARLSLAVHQALADAMAAAAAAAVPPGAPLALAGGCFQNALLLELCAAAARSAGLRPFWSEQVPCNDGGLALGQLWAVCERPS
jgi:hydrogenase maturation protein HypF